MPRATPEDSWVEVKERCSRCAGSGRDDSAAQRVTLAHASASAQRRCQLCLGHGRIIHRVSLAELSQLLKDATR